MHKFIPGIFFYNPVMVEVDSAQFFHQMRVAEENMYGTKDPRKYKPYVPTQELLQCLKCQVYHDDPEHWCGSVALCPIRHTPQQWRLIHKTRRWYHIHFTNKDL